MPRIILASQSPRRKKLLQQLGLAFEVFPSHSEEHSTETDPALLVEELALMKAKDVAGNFQDSLVIGADTVVVHRGEILGKPESPEEAASMLLQLSDSTHSVFTGVAMVLTDQDRATVSSYVFHEQTKVTFSALDEAEIVQYISGGSPMDKAGAYGIQDDLGALFVERIEGDYYNVVGFPLNRFYREMKTFTPELSLLNP